MSFVLFNMKREIRWMCCISVFISCFYVGATAAALFTLSLMWGILFVLLLAIEDIAICIAATFVCLCDKALSRRLSESVRDTKQVGVFLLLGFAYKVIAYFVVLKLLTSVI